MKMGTNYYLEKPDCPHCGRPYERLHIGKSSAGWCFALHIYPEIGINELKDWSNIWCRSDTKIVNEYGDIISIQDMYKQITDRSFSGSAFTDGWLAENHAILGPNGLARIAIGKYCIGHGDGTYDLLVGEFG